MRSSIAFVIMIVSVIMIVVLVDVDQEDRGEELGGHKYRLSHKHHNKHHNQYHKQHHSQQQLEIPQNKTKTWHHSRQCIRK